MGNVNHHLHNITGFPLSVNLLAAVRRIAACRDNGLIISCVQHFFIIICDSSLIFKNPVSDVQQGDGCQGDGVVGSFFLYQGAQ